MLTFWIILLSIITIIAWIVIWYLVDKVQTLHATIMSLGWRVDYLSKQVENQGRFAASNYYEIDQPSTTAGNQI